MGRARELAELATAYDGRPLMFRNRIINGDCRIDARNNGASVTVNTNSVVFAVDRVYSFVLGAACTAQRVSSGRTDFPFALRVTGAASNTYVEVGQRIESFNSADLVGGSVTVSFLAARSSGTSVTVRLSYANTVDGHNAGSTSIATQAVTIGSTLAQYTVTFNSLPSQTANGLQLGFEFGAVGSGQTVTITGVQLEAGSVATPFERVDYGTSLMRCQRYYQQSNPTVAASALTTTEPGYNYFPAWCYSTTNGVSSTARLPVVMRSTPTVTILPSAVSGVTTSGRLSFFQNSGWTSVAGSVHPGTGPQSIAVDFGGSFSAGPALTQWHYTASSEL